MANNIIIDKAILSIHNQLEPINPNNHQEEKRHLMAKIQEEICQLRWHEGWAVTETDDGLDQLSRELLTQLLSAV